jgi:hypothetical protein
LYRQQFCGERDDIGHARKLVPEVSRRERIVVSALRGGLNGQALAA